MYVNIFIVNRVALKRLRPHIVYPVRDGLRYAGLTTYSRSFIGQVTVQAHVKEVSS